MPFVAGVELNRRFFLEAVAPVLDRRFPRLRYAAALMGPGSDVLGYDSQRSTDHDWGPRPLLFLSPGDFDRVGGSLDAALRADLPRQFSGYPVSFRTSADDGVRIMEATSRGPVNHGVRITTLDQFLMAELGVTASADLGAHDWLRFPEQRLQEVTAGAVYHDGLGELNSVRDRLGYHPQDVWLYRLAAQWQRVSQEEAFVGRAAEAGDELGSSVLAARLVRDVMRLAFLLERRYAPYGKWLGPAFRRLEAARDLAPLLSGVLSGPAGGRQRALARAYSLLAARQNDLAVAAWTDPSPSLFHGPPLFGGAGRPYTVIHAERFAAVLVDAIQDEHVRQVHGRLGLVGGIDQWVDSTDALTSPELCRKLGVIYQ